MSLTRIDSGAVNPSQPPGRVPAFGPLRGIVLTVALALTLAGCNDDPEVAGDSAPTETERSTTSIVETSPVTVPAEAQRVDSLAPGDTMSPGRWATGALETPASFQVASPMVLLQESDRLVALGTPEPGVSQAPNALVVLNPAGVIVFDGVQPSQAPFPSDLGRWLDESPTVDVTGSGTLPGGVWWDIATSETASTTTPCQFGDRCVEWLVLADGSVSVVGEQADWRFRVFDLDLVGAEPLLVLAQAPADAFDDLVELGAALVATARTEPRDDFPLAEPSTDGLAQVMGREPLPPGQYRQDLDGFGALLLDAEAPLDVVLGSSDGGGAAFFDTLAGPPGAFVIFADYPLVEPADATSGGVDLGTTDDPNIGAWADAVAGVAVVGQGEGTLGGRSTQWWDLAIDPDASEATTTPCDFDPSRRCVHLVEEGDEILDIVEGSATRIHVFADVPLKLFVQPNDRNPQAPSLDEILARFQPLFDRLTIEP